MFIAQATDSPRTNTLAYSRAEWVTKLDSFVTLKPGIFFIYTNILKPQNSFKMKKFFTNWFNWKEHFENAKTA